MEFNSGFKGLKLEYPVKIYEKILFIDFVLTVNVFTRFQI